MKVIYFAWVRERVGKTEETIDPPPSVRTINDLIQWLVGVATNMLTLSRNRWFEPRSIISM